MAPTAATNLPSTAASAPEYPSSELEYHLSSVNLSFNNIPYCIVGRIAFDFRSQEGAKTLLDSIRLAPLISPDSQASPTCIDVIFRGRWRTSCAFLKKRDVICVTRAQVAPADDVEIHNVQLVLRDPNFESPPIVGRQLNPSTAAAALFVLTPDGPQRRPKLAVSFKHLDLGCLNCDAPATPTKSVARDTVHAPNPRAAKLARTATSSPTTPDAAVAVAATAAGAPASTDRKHGRDYTYKSIEQLWDEVDSNPGGPYGLFNVYGVVVDARAPSTTGGPDLRSDVTVVDESSLRGAGGAMEVKTLYIHRFDRSPRNGVPYRAVGDIIRGHRLVLRRYDHNGRVHVQGGAKAHSTFLLWGCDGEDMTPIADRGPTHGPGAATPPKHTLTDFDRARVAALRAFSRRYIAGIATPQRPFMRTVAQVVEAPFGAAGLAQSFDLLALYTPSTAAPAVDAMTGGVRFSVSDGRPYVHHVLRVNSVLSDVHRLKCPNYRFADFFCSFRHRPDRTEKPHWLLIRDARVRARAAPGAQREIALTIQKHSSTLLWLPAHAPEVRAHLRTDAEPHSGGGGGAYGMPGNTAGNVQPPLMAAAVESEGARERARIERELARRWRTLGTHDGMHLPVRTVRDVRRAADVGSRAAMRVQARVRGWVTPRDVRFAARPFCAPCREFVAKRAAQCDTCGSRLGWAFLVRLILGDDDGCLVQAWVTAEHADRFFGPVVVARDLTRDEKGANYVRRVAVELLNPSVRLDCLVQPYIAEDRHGVPGPVCRVVHTALKLP